MPETVSAEAIHLDIFPLPEVAWRVLSLTSDLEIESRLLEEVIERDPALVARILQRANSAQFSVSGEVSTIRRAALILGNYRLRSIAILLSLEGVFGCTMVGQAVWEHSLAVGLASRELARHWSVRNEEEAFVAGLLHDIGKVVLDRCLPTEYGQLLADLADGEGALLEREQDRLGTDHTHVGSNLARTWGLPDHLEEVIRLHHAPSGAKIDPDLCTLVRIADTTCRTLGIGRDVAGGLPADDDGAELPFRLDTAAAGRICEPVRAMFEAEAVYFGFNRPRIC